MTEDSQPSDFIRTIIENDIAAGKNDGKVVTRFPPEPNGYLHIGHAKSICYNFSVAKEFGGHCNLRFDDTNPVTEDTEYVESIQEDIKWLGFDWGDSTLFASDYFEKLYGYAVHLIKDGKAYVCSLTADETREYRGTLTEPGKNSPYRDRTVDENLDLFEKMRDGQFEDGEHVLRAKIDMSSPNLNLRDPTLYRIRHAEHHRTGKAWCIYPMYDYTHCISDALEGITHSLCSLEFEDHRPLYDWCLDNLPVPCHPQQIEFARLNLAYTVLSKRRLIQLVQDGHVTGWNDPRMPTLAGMRRRGYPPAAIRDFCVRIGMSKADNLVDMAMLDFCLREELNKKALRVMAVLNPLKVIIDNYPEDQVEELDADNNPEDPEAGKRKIPFAKEIYIEASDFEEDPPKKFFRLAPGKEVRLKHAYYIKFESIERDEATGEIKAIHCTYDPDTRGGWSDDGRKVKGTLHWVSAQHAIPATVRIYDHLFTQENPMDVEEGKDFTDSINPDSLEEVTTCLVEPSLKDASPGTAYQFIRNGYFCVDPKDSTTDSLVFNRTVGLRDTWAKIQKKG